MWYLAYADPQQRPPLGLCPCCGRELWEVTAECPFCRVALDPDEFEY